MSKDKSSEKAFKIDLTDLCFAFYRLVSLSSTYYSLGIATTLATPLQQLFGNAWPSSIQICRQLNIRMSITDS